MLGKSIIGFKREQFVKDLYDPKLFLNNFNDVHFSSVETFVKCMEAGYYIPRDILRIDVRSDEDYQILKEIILETGLTDIAELYLNLKYGNDLTQYGELAHKYFTIVTAPEIFKKNMEDGGDFMKFRRANPTAVKYIIDADTYRTTFNKMKKDYWERTTRMFIVDFNYISLSKLSQEDLHEFQFHLNHFMHWVFVSRENPMSRNTEERHQGMELMSRGSEFLKPIYVDPWLRLWFNEEHQRDGDSPDINPLFTLQADKNGEDIPYRELNLIRQYIDLPVEALTVKDSRNISYINYYHNTKLMNALNEVPLITELILKWIMI